MSKSLKIILMILVFGIIILGGANVQASTVTNATEIQEELGTVNAEVSGNTVKLLRNLNLTLTNEMIFSSGTAIFDLNGKNLTVAMDSALFNIIGGNLTVMDSTNTTGAIRRTGENELFHLDMQGKLTIENGIFENTNESIIGIESSGVDNAVPTLIIKNGTFTTLQKECIWGTAGNITIENGKFDTLDSKSLSFDSKDGNMNVTINNCEINGGNDNIYISGGNLIINDGKFISSNGIGSNIDSRNDNNNNGTNNKIIINGGTYSTANCTGANLNIYMNNQECPQMKVIVNGGKFSSKEESWDTIVLNGGNLEVNGGIFTSKTQNGVLVHKGTLVINGGDFSGKWTGLFYNPLNANVTLKGGRYESLATDMEDNHGGISTNIDSNIKPFENLAPGYDFYEDDTIVEKGRYYCTKSIVTIELHRYNIIANESTNGTVTLEKDYATKNETVTIATTPREGYKLKSLTVTTKGGANVEVLNNKFTMPEEDVSIKTEFELVSEEVIVEEKDETPKTGINGANCIGITMLLAGVLIVGMMVMRKR